MCWWNFVHDLASCIDTNVQCQFSHSKTALISVPQIIIFALDLWRFQTHHFFPLQVVRIFSPTTFMSTPRWHQESIRPGSKVKDCDPATEQLTEITARQAWPSAGDEAFQCYGWNEDNEGVGWGCWVFCVSILIGGLVWSSLYTCELCTVKEYVSVWMENVQGPPWHFWYLNLLDCNKTMFLQEEPFNQPTPLVQGALFLERMRFHCMGLHPGIPGLNLLVGYHHIITIFWWEMCFILI